MSDSKIRGGHAKARLFRKIHDEHGKAADPPPDAPRRLSSQSLLLGARELHIEHNGERYTLRLTSQGKLILTK